MYLLYLANRWDRTALLFFFLCEKAGSGAGRGGRIDIATCIYLCGERCGVVWCAGSWIGLGEGVIVVLSLQHCS